MQCEIPAGLIKDGALLRRTQEFYIQFIKYLDSLRHLLNIPIYTHKCKNLHCFYSLRCYHRDLVLVSTHQNLIMIKKEKRSQNLVKQCSTE